MATPAEHKTAVNDYFAKKASSPGLFPNQQLELTAEVHAILATKAGTGTEYAAAEALLAEDGGRGFKLSDAKLHALLAD